MTQFKEPQWQQEVLSETFSLPVLENEQQITEADIPTIDLRPMEVTQTSDEPLTGVYSSSGFDMVGVLSKLVNR